MNTIQILTIAIAVTFVMGFVATLPLDSASAAQRNNLAASNRAGDNTQEGLVNVGNVGVNANVGANVCALSRDC